MKFLSTYYTKNVTVIPQVRTYTRNGTESVVMFDYAESPISTQGRFRTNEFTRLVPTPVHSVLRNDKWGGIK